MSSSAYYIPKLSDTPSQPVVQLTFSTSDTISYSLVIASHHAYITEPTGTLAIPQVRKLVLLTEESTNSAVRIEMTLTCFPDFISMCKTMTVAEKINTRVDYSFMVGRCLQMFTSSLICIHTADRNVCDA